MFAAVGAHSGLPYKAAHDVPSAFGAMGGTVPKSSATHPVPTIIFHGIADGTVNPSNGLRIAEEAQSGGTEILDEGTISGRSYKRTTILSNTGGLVLEHWRIEWLPGRLDGRQQVMMLQGPILADCNRACCQPE